MRDFNRDVFITALFIWIILTFGSMFFLLHLYGIFEFPVLTLFPKASAGFASSFISLFINSAFYAFLIERIYLLLMKIKENST
jgi:hypothetical protein